MRFRDERPTIIKRFPNPERATDSPVVLATARQISPIDPATGMPRKGFSAEAFMPVHNSASRRAARKPFKPFNLRRMTAAIKQAQREQEVTR